MQYLASNEFQNFHIFETSVSGKTSLLNHVSLNQQQQSELRVGE